jgi:hypothetical protein
MQKTFLSPLLALAFVSAVGAADTFAPVAGWLKLPEGRAQLGNMHGDIAVSSTGEVYVSVQDPQAGVQVYAPDGRFLRTVANAPEDFHGFVIRRQPDGEFIFGARLRGQTVMKMTLDGTVVLTIPASSIPDDFKVRNAQSGQLGVQLTGVEVGPNGDIYATDGYASDFVHRFDRRGKYLSSFGGRKEPYSFNTLHKIALDTRFQPARLIATDRANNRVVHLSLDGQFLGIVARNLLLPAALAISGNNVFVGELTGRLTVLDKAGAVVAHLGANTEPGVGGNKVPPEQWRTGFFVAPHGVAFNPRGDLFVAEYSTFGRVHRFNKQ